MWNIHDKDRSLSKALEGMSNQRLKFVLNQSDIDNRNNVKEKDVHTNLDGGWIL
jgi:hypothetical protein